MASVFNQVDFTKFVADYSIKNGELVDEFALNLSPQRLKKEVNNVHNIINILNDRRLLDWNPVEDYLVGELVQNQAGDDKYYRAKKISINKRPDLFLDEWEVAKNTDYTDVGDFSNYLAKDNEEGYSPTGQYNPATKGYVDFKDAQKLDIDGKALDSALLNGEAVTSVLGTSLTKPASQKLVDTVNNRIDTKLDSTEFNATNVMAMVQNVDGVGTGLDADYLDGLSSEFFMKVGTTTNFDTMLTPGSYLISPGGTGAPDTMGTYAIVVSGQGNYVNQIATSVTENKLYYRSYVGSWTSWREFASATGSVATAEKLASPVTIELSGDVEGQTSFDGSTNVNIISTVADDSHLHDGRYYTELEADNRFLGINAKADDASLLDGLDNTQFLRTDIGGTVSELVIFEKNVDIDGDINVTGTTANIHTEYFNAMANQLTIGDEDIPTESTANYGGIVLLGATNKTIQWHENDNKWHFSSGIVADTFTGTASNADKLDNYDSSKTAIANTVVVRDGSGNISGTSSSAKYADLAEMYSSKEKYTPGTLIQISTSDNYDVEENTDNVFGIVSDKPGFLLDDTLDGVPVAMVGKTPVRIIGLINKGDKITASGSVAVKANINDKVIGISLENKYTEEETLIKCFVQVQL